MSYGYTMRDLQAMSPIKGDGGDSMRNIPASDEIIEIDEDGNVSVPLSAEAERDALRAFVRELADKGPLRIAEIDDGDWLVCQACRDVWPKTGSEHHYGWCTRQRALALLGDLDGQ